ncbi:MAG: recombinase family protein [Steroidobacteraceae bacterium]
MKKSQTLRAAIYTRFSTDKQSSTAAQLPVCNDICRREGFRVVGSYSDEAISGGTNKRPEYRKLMEAARARAFDVIVAEDTSRLWRNLADQWTALKELQDLGIHVVGHGLDTRREDATLSLAIQGAMADVYRAEIGRRTKRSLMELAKKGEPTGGRSYGYKVEGGKRKIVKAEAKIVLRIYEQRAKGWSALRIARNLNADNVPTPGAHWNRKKGNKAVWRTSAIAGDHRRGIGILNNELYRGNLFWNRYEWVRGATDSAIRKPVLRPREDWTAHNFENLRIVPEALWLKVQRLQTEESPKRRAIKAGIKSSPWKARPKLWLSGILACESCRGNLAINGRNYVCPSAHVGKCGNQLQIRRNVVEAKILSLLRKHLLDPKRMGDEIKRVEKLLKVREKEEVEELRLSVDRSELRRIESEIAKIRKLDLGASIKQAALNAALAERGELEERASRGVTRTGMARSMLARLPELAKIYERQIDAALGRDATQDAIEDARNATAQLIEGGKMYLKAVKEGARAQVRFLGLGTFVLQVAKVRQPACPNGSGGRI